MIRWPRMFTPSAVVSLMSWRSRMSTVRGKRRFSGMEFLQVGRCVDGLDAAGDNNRAGDVCRVAACQACPAASLALDGERLGEGRAAVGPDRSDKESQVHGQFLREARPGDGRACGV